MIRPAWIKISRAALPLALILLTPSSRACAPIEPTQTGQAKQQHSAIGLAVMANPASPSGLQATYVFPTGPAGKAGLRSGDIILRIDGKRIDLKGFAPYIESKAPGSQIAVEYERAKATTTAVITTEERSAMYKRIASSEPAPPSSVIGELSAKDAQGSVLAALSDERGHNISNIHLASNYLAFRRTWGNGQDQRVDIVVSLVSHAYLQTPKHFFQEGWTVNFISTPYYVAWNDRDEAARFALAINRLIWENSPQIYAQKILEHDALEQQMAAWRAAGSKADPPEEAQRHFALAQSAYQEKNLGHAAEELSAAVESYPTWPVAQHDLAAILSELNRYPEAIQHMQMYLELTPDAPNADDSRKQIWIWQDKVKGGNN